MLRDHHSWIVYQGLKIVPRNATQEHDSTVPREDQNISYGFVGHGQAGQLAWQQANDSAVANG